MQPGRFTELFLLDEATAMAAGHRPCALCRREDYRRFMEIVRLRGADVVDARLHSERLPEPFHRAPFASLPDGAFVLRDGEPWLVVGDALLRWTPGGYTSRVVRPGRGPATVITPPSLLEVLRSGWRGVVPLLHPSATAA